jgi:hypothetical protein
MPTTLAVDAGVDISVHILGHITAVDFGVESARSTAAPCPLL